MSLARVRSHLRFKQMDDRVDGAEAALFRMAAEAEARSGQLVAHAERVAVTSRVLGESPGLPELRPALSGRPATRPPSA
jgi:response regulator RpfG family c-di-GMP phosphodiesterase